LDQTIPAKAKPFATFGKTFHCRHKNLQMQRLSVALKSPCRAKELKLKKLSRHLILWQTRQTKSAAWVQRLTAITFFRTLAIAIGSGKYCNNSL